MWFKISVKLFLDFLSITYSKIWLFHYVRGKNCFYNSDYPRIIYDNYFINLFDEWLHAHKVQIYINYPTLLFVTLLAALTYMFQNVKYYARKLWLKIMKLKLPITKLKKISLVGKKNAIHCASYFLKYGIILKPTIAFVLANKNIVCWCFFLFLSQRKKFVLCAS